MAASSFKSFGDRLPGWAPAAAAAALGASALGGAAYLLYLRQPKSQPNLPKTMRAVRLIKHIPDYRDIKDPSQYLEVAEVPMPVPKHGEVLVRMERAPINPSDLSSLQGTYNSSKRAPLPCQCGFEGSGVVVATGGGVLAGKLFGKKVACAARGDGRTWAEYAVFTATNVVELPDDVTFEEGCAVFVNPLTVAAFVEIARAGGHKAILHTAAASALGKMLNKHAKRYGIEVINVVRKPEQKATLEALGAKYVVVTSEESWPEKLAELCKQLDCRIGFDAVGGELVGTLLKAMPPKSTLHVYGGLAQEAIGKIRVTDVLFLGKTLKGFWLTPYLAQKSLLGRKRMADRVVRYLKEDFKTEFAAAYPLDKIGDALLAYTSNMNKKLCIAPQLRA